MRKLTCIVCPLGCSLEVQEVSGQSEEDTNLNITGNRCHRGLTYAQEEIRSPKRIVTASCRINSDNAAIKRLPVKTSVPCPKEKIPALLQDIYQTKINLPVRCGTAVISDWMGLGIDVIATRTVKLQEMQGTG